MRAAASHKDWNAGGLFPPVDTDPKTQKPTDCVVLMQLTTKGFVYAKDVTKPNMSVYNCDSRNNVAVHSYQTS